MSLFYAQNHLLPISMEPNLRYRQEHWETVCQTKAADQVSWYEPVPTASLHS